MLIPGYDPFRDAGDCYFDADKGLGAANFFGYLQHVKGEWAGKPFDLEPWQRSFVMNLFGWLRPGGTRRYRECLLFIPRKNGKSALAAGIANYMTFIDKEPGAEIYCAAAEREQATLVFEVAKAQVERNPKLKRLAEIQKHVIRKRGDLTRFRAISAEAGSKHGFNPHCVIIDELHAQKDRELVDVLMTGCGARRQPLILHITTSDYEREGSICNEKHDYACKVRDGIIPDPYFLPVIYEASRDDDWTSPETWAKANPNLGISVNEEFLEHECKRAIDEPSYENTFKRLFLNIRTEQADRWIQMDKWDACVGPMDDEFLKKRRCFAGLDLSTKADLSALVLAFPVDKKIFLKSFFWLPENRLAEKEKEDRIPYSVWVRKGLLKLTEGDVVDYAAIRMEIGALARQYKIKEVAADPWNAIQLLTELDADGFDAIEFRQGYASMSAPAKELEKHMIARTLVHDGNPVMRWMASNVAVMRDPAGNIKPARDKSAHKIDGIVAAIMAVGRVMVNVEKQSCYKSRGFLRV